MNTVSKSNYYMPYLLFPFICILLVGVILEQNAYPQERNVNAAIQIKEGDSWDYYKGVQSPPSNWKKNDFNAINWQKGMSGFGYGSSYIRTYLEDMKDRYLSVYARRSFSIQNIYSVIDMNLYIVCDGPFIAYLNGMEIIRNDVPLKSSVDQTTGRPKPEQLNISGFIHELMPGPNVLSIECSNDDIKSNDFTFIPIFEVIEQSQGEIQ